MLFRSHNMVMSLLFPSHDTDADATLIVKDSADPTKGVLFGVSSYDATDTLEKTNVAPTPSHGCYASQVRTSSTGSTLIGFSGYLTAADSSLKISALRSATALQKYKEIQNSNDPDFANQVLAHILVLSLRLIHVLLFL